MKKFSGFYTKDGLPILTQEYAQSIRDLDSSQQIVAQLGGQEDMLASPADINIVGGSRGGSKGQPYSSPIITPFGIRKMGDLKIGDAVCGKDGHAQKVICITELGGQEVYRITFSDKTYVDCTHDHIWTLLRTCSMTKKRKLIGGSRKDDYRNWTTDMIYDYLQTEHKSKTKKGLVNLNLVIPLCDEVHFTHSFGTARKTHFSPYIIGALIGDGCIAKSLREGKSNVAMLTTADEGIRRQFEKENVRVIYTQQRKNLFQIYYSDKELEKDLQSLKLTDIKSEDKFIPIRYKEGTIADRWSLVQGLMDTDGTVDSRGHCSYSTISPRLAEDMAFILRSLGAYVTISKDRAEYKKNNIYIRCADVYNLYIKIRNSERLFRLPRKIARCKAYNNGCCEPTKRIVSCEKIGYDKCRCIAVSNPDALYLTNDFTTTHNSWSLLLEAKKDVKNPNFYATILRNEKPDLEDLVDESYKIFGQDGNYNKSLVDMTWYFNSGGKLKFSYYSDDYENFKKRFQGKQFAFIGIDEITHCPYKKFKYLITDNRNAYHIRSRFWGTCNPDPDSWVAQFISWWIDDDGYPIAERNGMVRYCYMPSNDIGEIYWGDTREEVFDQCREDIMKHWRPKYAKYGSPSDLFIKSVAFVEAKLEDNIKLMASNPAYLANLANQDEEQQSRDLDGNWKFRAAGDDMIKMDDMMHLFNNAEQTDKGKLYATADVALMGGDNLVMWLWKDWHIKDVYVCRFDSKTALNVINERLEEWGVQEENFTYDYSGIGQYLDGFMPNAVHFNNQAAPIAQSKAENVKGLYKDLKSQSAFLFYKKIKDGEISIAPYLLDLKFDGNGYSKMPLRDILLKERKCIRRNADSDGKAFQLISKKDMKKIVGHSPDFFESLFFRMIFDLNKRHVKAKNTWLIK